MRPSPLSDNALPCPDIGTLSRRYDPYQHRNIGPPATDTASVSWKSERFPPVEQDIASIADLNDQLAASIARYPSLYLHSNVSKANKRIFAVDIAQTLRAHVLLLWPQSQSPPAFQRVSIASIDEGVRI